MKQRIVFCLLLAFSAAAHGNDDCDFFNYFWVAIAFSVDNNALRNSYNDCEPPLPPAYVTTPTKDKARLDQILFT